MAQTARTLTTTSRPRIRWCSIALTLMLFAPAVLALGSDPLRYRGGVRTSPTRGLGKKQLNAVLKTLRQKTGLMGLDFDGDGFLQLGDQTQITGGSTTARELLSAAIDGDTAFDLETHERSRIVAFARLASPIRFQSQKTSAEIDVLPVEIDFSDFDRLRGDRQVIASFDLGMVLLHELAHGVLGLRDAPGTSDGLGECEAHINQIRRELNLPERQSYMARVADRQSSNSGAVSPHAELLFSRATVPSDSQGRTKRELFVLFWEVASVGQILNETVAPRGRAGTVASQ
ncbi:MAG: hypothetical protein ABI882_12065 [Acidobacteriota bacterium]